MGSLRLGNKTGRSAVLHGEADTGEFRKFVPTPCYRPPCCHQSYISNKDSRRFWPCFARERAQSSDCSNAFAPSEGPDCCKSCSTTHRDDASLTEVSQIVSNPRTGSCAVARIEIDRERAIQSTMSLDQNLSCSYPSKITTHDRVHSRTDRFRDRDANWSVEKRSGWILSSGRRAPSIVTILATRVDLPEPCGPTMLPRFVGN